MDSFSEMERLYLDKTYRFKGRNKHLIQRISNSLFCALDMCWRKVGEVMEWIETREYVSVDGAVPKANENLVEVVRCKDCKKRNSWECWQYFLGRIKIPDDWFCADAERKGGIEK